MDLKMQTGDCIHPHGLQLLAVRLLKVCIFQPLLWRCQALLAYLLLLSC